MVNEPTPVRSCALCDRQHGARGLYNACYKRALRAGTLPDHERWNRPADELLDEWVLLRDDGYRPRDAAARIGVTYTALDKALCRAKRRGDPRGSRVPHAHDMRHQEAS